MASVRTTLAVAATLCAALLSVPAGAQDAWIPEALEDWREWVLEDKAFLECPRYFDRHGTAPADYACAWPATLDLDIAAGGGRFTQRWQVVAGDAWLPLPGDTDAWPEQVTANGEPIAVVLRDGVPSVRVTTGSWRLAGRFVWGERPGVLRVPPESGLLALTVDGQAVTRPVLSRTGVFLGDPQRETQAADAVETAVYRLVTDDVPLRLTTRLRIDVSGAAREASFGPLLPDAYVPMQLESSLPARLEADGRLRVQVRPGSWEVTLVARAPGVEDAVTMPAGGDNLPAEEIWSYQSNDLLRVTSATGTSPVDPGQALVPGEWAGFPAFRLEAGDALEIEERSRGRTDVDNDLSLSRKLWVDFDGRGMTVRDQVQGEMRTDWRLDMRPPFTLESATEAGESLLVTAGDEPGETGIEVRQARLDVTTTARGDPQGNMPVTGWDERFTHVAATLYLPPGNQLFAAPGSDQATGSWFGKWQLLDFFLVLIITIAAWRLFGRVAGTVAFAALVLSFHEVGAPAWLWLNLLVAVALLRVAPGAGWLRNAVRAFAVVASLLLVIALVPFVAGQLRIAIYPQLEAQYGGYSPAYSRAGTTAPAAPPAESDAYAGSEQQMLRKEMRAADSIEEILVTATAVQGGPTDFPRYASDAVVQTGPGIPAWEWNRAELRWNGPVDPEQTMRLFVLPRWAVTLLRFAEVALLLAFAGLVGTRVIGQRWRWPAIGTGRRSTAALLVALGTCFATPDAAKAQVPTPELLGELERRLTRAPECAPRCAEITAAAVRIDDNVVSMLLAVDALEEVAVPLPGTTDGWRPDAVQLDASSPAEVLRGDDQRLWVRVPPGRHAVNLRGATGATDSLEIVFPSPPRVIEVAATGWAVAGVRDRRLVAGALQFSRQAQAGGTGNSGGPDAPARWESDRFPAFAEIVRTVDLGLDWAVATTVRRVAPAEGALTLRVPLLPGESVLAERLPVTDGEVLVTLGPGQQVVSWPSRLPRTSPLRLAAGDRNPWKEIWQVRAGSIWHVDFEGVPESIGGSTNAGVRTSLFYPRAGEELSVTATRPEATAGAALAMDAVAVHVDQGDRSRNGSVSFNYRSTRGGQHVVRLPAAAELVRVAIDGAEEPLRIDDGAVTLPVLPGEHEVVIEWRDATPAGVVSRVPAVDLGAPAGNVDLELQVPASRWLLLTHGPKLGPSVLYWSELVVLVLFAALLSRIDWTPLRFHHWLLLGLGFSTFNWGVLAIVVAWLLAVGARDRWRLPLTRGYYNAMQAGIVLLTLLALAAIVVSLPRGLLGAPDMHVTGNGSTRHMLLWFADRSEALTPTAAAWSVPLWFYKLLILAWALWLSLALIKWLPWTWRIFARDGYFDSGRDAGTVDRG